MKISKNCPVFEKAEKNARQTIIKKYTENVNCFRYHLELVKIFGFGEPYYGLGGHVLTLMPNGRMYDKKGVALYPMKEEPKIYEQAFNWGDTNNRPPSAEDRLDKIEKMIGLK